MKQLAILSHQNLVSSIGFHKTNTDRWEFANEGFLRGQKHLLRNIHRRRSSQIQQLGGYLGGSIELRRSGLEDELENLSKEKTLLVKEVVKLQKEHLTMIHQMDTVKQRMQLAEQRQKQMVSFLAKILQNPAFLDHLRRQKEQREIATTRVKRKFLPQLKLHQGKLSSPCDGKIVKYEQTQDCAILSSMNQVTETNVPNQLPDSLFQEMEDKPGLDMNRQEFLQTLYETGERTPAFMDNDDVSLKGKGIVSSPMGTITADAEYFVSFPGAISQEKIFLDAISQETDVITLPEETWNMNFISGDSLLNPGKDVWDNLFDEDTHEQGTEAGSSTAWNMESRKGDLELDKLVGDKSFFQTHQDHAGVVKEDSPKNMDP